MNREPASPNLRLIAGEGLVPSDADLLERHARGDDRAFDTLVRRYHRAVLRVALRFARDRDDAEDLAQRTFLRELVHARRARPGSAFKSWLFRIAANLSKNHLRDRAKLVLGMPLMTAQDAVADGVEVRQRAQRVRSALARLPRRQREVMTLRLDAELPFADVAHALGITENNAKVCFHHGARRLKELLSGEEL